MLEDGSLLAGGYAPTHLALKLTVGTEVQDITAFRLELMTDPNLPLGGPGRSLKGMGALTDFEVEAAPADDPEKSSKIKIVSAEASLWVPERLLEPIFDDKSGLRKVTGRLRLQSMEKRKRPGESTTVQAGGISPARRSSVWRLPSPIRAEPCSRSVSTRLTAAGTVMTIRVTIWGASACL